MKKKEGRRTLTHSDTDKIKKRGRDLYTIQAALEHLISLLITGSFLAKLTGALGFNDSLTGILSAVVSLGSLFQLLSLALGRRKTKSFVIYLSVVNQLLFTVLYVVPFVPMSQGVKAAVFAIALIVSYVAFNLAHPKKISWLMSLVEDTKRGSYTAVKEIISLIAGMIFSVAMGSIADSFEEAGNIRIFFIIAASVIAALSILHTLSLIFITEKYVPEDKERSVISSVKGVLKDSNVYKLAGIFLIYYIAHHISIPFYGTYMINELGLGLDTVSILTLLGSIARILVSRFWGSYGDKRSFAHLTEKCFIFLALAFLSAAVSSPVNGIIAFALYNILHGIAMGGINSALTNLIFDYAPLNKRSDYLAICQASAGLGGFLTTVAVSPIVTVVQKKGAALFGMNFYAQQIMSVISIVITVAAIVYVRAVFIKGQAKNS